MSTTPSTATRHAINWFELPVTDLERACRFYETVLATRLKSETFGGMPMAMFPAGGDAVGGALVLDQRRKPGGDTIVYLNANGILDQCADRIEKAGGKVLLPKTDIGEPGHILLLLDSEGNQVGLHAERAAR
jgi:predicted enzyme related to lactoylglutathione lyase